MNAFVLVVVVFVACAPPPLKEPSVEIARAPAAVNAVIVAVSEASSVIAPVVALTLVSALAIDAWTVLSIVFVARATAIAIAAPTGAIDAATATDPVVAVIREVSRAERPIAVAWMPVAPSPSIVRLDVGGDPVLGGRAGAGGREAVQAARDRDGARDHDRVDRLVRERRRG